MKTFLQSTALGLVLLATSSHLMAASAEDRGTLERPAPLSQRLQTTLRLITEQSQELGRFLSNPKQALEAEEYVESVGAIARIVGEEPIKSLRKGSGRNQKHALITLGNKHAEDAEDKKTFKAMVEQFSQKELSFFVNMLVSASSTEGDNLLGAVRNYINELKEEMSNSGAPQREPVQNQVQLEDDDENLVDQRPQFLRQLVDQRPQLPRQLVVPQTQDQPAPSVVGIRATQTELPQVVNTASGSGFAAPSSVASGGSSSRQAQVVRENNNNNVVSLFDSLVQPTSGAATLPASLASGLTRTSRVTVAPAAPVVAAAPAAPVVAVAPAAPVVAAAPAAPVVPEAPAAPVVAAAPAAPVVAAAPAAPVDLDETSTLMAAQASLAQRTSAVLDGISDDSDREVNSGEEDA